MTGRFLITGATGPVAGATIERLAARGDALLLTGRNETRLIELGLHHGEPGRIETHAVDVTTPMGAQDAVDATVNRLGGIDGVVHMVGSFQAGPVANTPPERYEALMRVNFLSAVYVTQAVLQAVRGESRLVYFGTPLVQEPLAGLGCYSASKAALLTWMRSMSHEVKHRSVHANAVVMTMADTPDARAARPHVDFTEAVTPELVARTVEFLTSDAADGLYGALVPVLGRFGFSSALAGPPGRSTPAAVGAR
jgi:NAD(P)-dependent dehydrogenase (short-subunit alcohol dehydrogenase family)